YTSSGSLTPRAPWEAGTTPTIRPCSISPWAPSRRIWNSTRIRRWPHRPSTSGPARRGWTPRLMSSRAARSPLPVRGWRPVRGRRPSRERDARHSWVQGVDHVAPLHGGRRRRVYIDADPARTLERQGDDCERQRVQDGSTTARVSGADDPWRMAVADHQ